MAIFRQKIHHDIEEVTQYECGTCGRLHRCEDGARECCEPEINEVSGYQCLGCNEVHLTQYEAKKCCTEIVFRCVSCEKIVEQDGECCPDLFVNNRN